MIEEKISKKNLSAPEASGVLIVNKHSGPTSHDIVNMVRKLYGTKRVGHTGTLDPMAEGVLVVLVGRAAKAAEYLVSDTKKYQATLRLGLTTDTQDTTGSILTEHKGELPSEEAVKKICQKFIGKSEQTPPMYSALKVNGKKLVDLARKGETVERSARPIEIFSLTCERNPESKTDYTIEATVSSGTYIRTLCSDIGACLGCGASMASLTRLETGGFHIEDAYTEADLLKMTREELISCLIPINSLFASLKQVNLSDFYEKLCRGGCEIYLKKIGNPTLKNDEKVRICNSNGEFFALGVVADYPDGPAVKAIKTFVL